MRSRIGVSKNILCIKYFKLLEKTVDFVRHKTQAQKGKLIHLLINKQGKGSHLLLMFICLFGVLHRFQHCTGHITTGSWKGRGNQYIEFARVVYCKLPTNGKQLPAFPLEPVRGSNPGLRGGRRECYHSATVAPSTLNAHPCRCCGKGPQTFEKCLAQNKVCNKCKKMGHFANCCFTKQVNDLSTDAQTSGNPQNLLLQKVELSITKTPMTFKIDTSADVSTISESSFHKLKDKPTTVVLKDWSALEEY